MKQTIVEKKKCGCKGCFFDEGTEITADEIWLTVKQNGNYEVSNFGNVRNKKTKRILKPAIQNKGYYMVSLSDKCKSHTYTIHKLVIEHFYRCAFENEVINHIDGNKLNNKISNLEYVSQRENCIKAWENKLCENVREKATGRKHNTSIKTSRKIIQLDLKGNIIAEYLSIRDAERKTGINNSSILRSCKNINKTAGGFIWNYKQ